MSASAAFYSWSHDAVIRVYDEADNLIETHEQAGDFKEWRARLQFCSTEKKQRDTSVPRSQGRSREAISGRTLAKNAQHQSSMCVYL